MRIIHAVAECDIPELGIRAGDSLSRKADAPEERYTLHRAQHLTDQQWESAVASGALVVIRSDAPAAVTAPRGRPALRLVRPDPEDRRSA